MVSPIVIILVFVFYSIACLGQGARLAAKSFLPDGILYSLGAVAIVLHGYLLYRWIDGGYAQNLYFFNVLSLIAWIACGLVWVSALRKPVANLLLLTYPLAVLSIILVLLFPGEYIIDTGSQLKQLVHILCSLLAFSVLVVAALQAVLLAIQDGLLRRKHMGGILRMLPPLQTMESLLFEIIGVGFILLSIVVVTSVVFFAGLTTVTTTHSPYLAIVAWLIFGILLGGRHFFRWRGRTAISWTMSGMGLLMLSYFGSWMLLSIAR